MFPGIQRFMPVGEEREGRLRVIWQLSSARTRVRHDPMLIFGTIMLMIPIIVALDTYDELRRHRTGFERRQDLRKKAHRRTRKPKG